MIIPPKYYPSVDDPKAKEYAVFMQQNAGEFAVHVGSKYIRRFTLDTMPVRLKQSLAMIHAFDWPRILRGQEYAPLSFMDYFPEQCKDIGWMTGPGEYTLVLEENLLHELRGSPTETAY